MQNLDTWAMEGKYLVLKYFMFQTGLVSWELIHNFSKHPTWFHYYFL